MLRRTHDHHRDIQPRLDATLSTDSSNHRNQDRHFMSQPKPQARKAARLLRWLSAGRGSARSNSQISTQIAQQSSPSNAASHLLVSPILLGQRPASIRLPSAASAAAHKSP